MMARIIKYHMYTSITLHKKGTLFVCLGQASVDRDFAKDETKIINHHASSVSHIIILQISLSGWRPCRACRVTMMVLSGAGAYIIVGSN